MWYSPEKYSRKIVDVNKELILLKGELEEKEAKISLMKFLYRNLGFCVQLLTGVILDPDQIITLKGMLESNYSLCVWSRGAGKTFMSATFCLLQSIFFPNSNIIVCGPTFRTSRFIFNKIIEISEGPNAQLLFQALGTISRRNDEFKVSINGGTIISIPLSGDKVRGYRANILVIDEFRLMSQQIIERVLMPFLVVPQNLTERQMIRAREDELIRRGVLKEEERMTFPNKAKFIGLSSASFKCEFLYKKYDEFVKQIFLPTIPENGEKYFVSQLAWNAIPEHRMDKEIIRLAQSDECNSINFRLEYGGEFADDSDSYFSMSKMMQCTIPDGETPTLLLSGNKSNRYILAIDPNLGNSDTGDNFAMCLIEIDEEDFKEGKTGGTVVHNYAKHGIDPKDHVAYFYYLWTNFNIVMICIDHAGYQFIDLVNESELFKKLNIDFKIIEFYAEKDGQELEDQLKMARRNYNKSINRIVFTQLFSTDSIRKMNEHLQGCIDYKKIWFGSGIKGDNSAFERAISTSVDLKLVAEDDTSEFIDTQEVLLKNMRHECAAIEVKTTAKGTQSFDLPQIFKRDLTHNRMRKDSYTGLLLGSWATKQFVDILKVPEETPGTWEPVLV